MISPAYAQGAPAGGGDFLISILPFVMIFVIIYFLIIRPQQKRVKQHQEMVSGIRRGDVIVMGGGIIGKVTKIIDDGEAQVEIADGVRIKIVRSMITEVRTRSEPVKGEAKS